MPRPAPAVDRTVAMVSFLAKYPGRGFTLSELSRELDINKATTHAIIAALVNAGWLIRDSLRKDYRLGPGLLGIARAATATEGIALDAARNHMRDLAAEFDVCCVASAIMGDEIVVLGVEGGPPPHGLVLEPGHRVPLSPPMGAIFLAWADPVTLDQRCEQFRAEHGEAAVARYTRSLDAIRAAGHAVSRIGQSRERLSQALLELARGATNRRVRATVAHLLDELEREEEDYAVIEVVEGGDYEVGRISAPVFDDTGRVVISLSLVEFDGRLTGRAIAERVARLLEVCGTVTASIDGRRPTGALSTGGVSATEASGARGPAARRASRRAGATSLNPTTTPSGTDRLAGP